MPLEAENSRKGGAHSIYANQRRWTFSSLVFSPINKANSQVINLPTKVKRIPPAEKMAVAAEIHSDCSPFGLDLRARRFRPATYNTCVPSVITYAHEQPIHRRLFLFGHKRHCHSAEMKSRNLTKMTVIWWTIPSDRYSQLTSRICLFYSRHKCPQRTDTSQPCRVPFSKSRKHKIKCFGVRASLWLLRININIYIRSFLAPRPL